jgi:pyruvate,water dikinase
MTTETKATDALIAEPPNPVHVGTHPDTRWTTVNFAEAIPGLQTPLGWSFWSQAMDTTVCQTFFNMGTLRRRQLPTRDPFAAIFYGRVAGNVDVFHHVGDRMPGSSGDIVVEKVLGVPAASKSRRPRSAYARLPIVAIKLPRAAMRSARELPGKLERTATWWRGAVLERPPLDLAGARELMREATRRFIDVGVPHATVSMLGGGLLDQLSALAERAIGDPSLAMDLATGYGGMEELRLIEDLWSAAQGELEIAELVRRWGYHGPEEGNLSSRSWREDSKQLTTLIANYQRAGVESPREQEATQIEHREQAEQRLLAGLPARARPGARLAMRMAKRYIPAREVGKAGFLHAVDAARCAARAGGVALAEHGLLADPEDVFFLTYDEFLEPPAGPLTELVAERREAHERYRRLALPPYWTGAPTPIELDDGTGERRHVSELHGIGIVGDPVTGRARVVEDPASAELDDGDILVCVTTDPSWTPLFMVASALVIDTGGAMSHGAIVARELGVTCVINTGTGTRDIPDGATITVDGRSGQVTIEREGPND